jgi:Transposase, Mutator family
MRAASAVTSIGTILSFATVKATTTNLAKALRPIYTAPTEPAARHALDELADTWGKRYPTVVRALEELVGRVRAVPRLRHRGAPGGLQDQRHRIARRPHAPGGASASQPVVLRPRIGQHQHEPPGQAWRAESCRRVS